MPSSSLLCAALSLLLLCCLPPLASAIPVPLHADNSAHISHSRSPSPSPVTQPDFNFPPRKPRGVWKITKVVSIFGPTVAIFIYDKAHNLYEHYQPFLQAAFIDFVQHLHAAVHSPYASKPLVWLSSMPAHDPTDFNPRVTAIANEIIRLTNLRLREHAVVSRIQMDDDHYELSTSLSSEHVKLTALKVMRAVLTNGSGRYLQQEEKIAVHALIASSVY